MPSIRRYVTLLFALSAPLWLAAAVVDTTRWIPVRLPLSALQFLAALAAALLATRQAGGSPRALLRRGFDVARLPAGGWAGGWRVGIVVLMPLTVGLAYALTRAAGPGPPDRLTPVASLPVFLGIYGVSAYCEQLGWTAVMTDALLASRPPGRPADGHAVVTTGVAVGATWAAWHLVPFWQTHHPPAWVAWQCAYTVAYRVLLTAAYVRTNRSVWATIVLHATYNTAFSMLPYYGSSYTPSTMALATLGVTCLVLWRMRPRRAPTFPDGGAPVERPRAHGARGPQPDGDPAVGPRAVRPAYHTAYRHRTRVVALAGALAGALVVAGVALAWHWARPGFAVPPPGGPYRIGTRTYVWQDPTRAELFTADPRVPRTVVAQVWYPAPPANLPAQDRAGAPAPYVADADAVTPALARLRRVPPFLLASLGNATTHATLAAPLADGEQRYPVLLFLEGLGGFRQMNTFQVEALASRGYVVVALDQPYTAAAVALPGGRVAVLPPLGAVQPLVRASYLPPYQPRDAPAEPVAALAARAHPLGGLPDGLIAYLAGDVRLALDRLAALDQGGASGRAAGPAGVFAGRLDLARVGVFGVSLGGIVAAEACRRDPRLRACLILDAPMPTAVVRAGLAQPVLWFTRPAADMRRERARAGGWPEPEIRAHLGSMRAVFDALPGDGYLVSVAGAFHLNFTDVARWTPLARALGLAGPIDPARAHAIVNAYTLAFFDRHLRGRPAPLLDASAADGPLAGAHIERHLGRSPLPGRAGRP